MNRRLSGTGRREFVGSGVALGITLYLSSDAVTATVQGGPDPQKPDTGDWIVKANDEHHQPLSVADIPLNDAPIWAWAMDPTGRTIKNSSRLGAILLLRLDPARLDPESRARSAEGVLAYSGICTHSGCDVSEWLADQQFLSCPCHDSEFDPKQGAKVVDGPATRALAALPLQVVDGKLVAARPFAGRVG